MATDTIVNSLIINKLTKAQYDAIQNKSETELYLVPDEIDVTPTSGSENPITSGGVYSALSEKQDTIDSSHKLSADLVEDGTTNKVYTATEKTKLSGIAAGAEVNVQSDWNQTTTTADDYIKNKPSIPTKVSDLTNDSGFISSYTETDPIFSASAASGITSTDISNWNAKVSNVQADWNSTSGLSQILNKPTLATVATSGSYNDLSNKPTIPDDSNLVHKTGFEVITGEKIFSEKFGIESTNGPYSLLIEKDGTTGIIIGYADIHPARPNISNIANFDFIKTVDGTDSQEHIVYKTLQQALDAKANTASLATVATSGSYDDLSNRPNPIIHSDITYSNHLYYNQNDGCVDIKSGIIPTVPTNVSAFTNDAGYLTSFTETDPIFTASAAHGITSSDISNWNSKTSNVGTITGITMNGVSKGTSGVVDLGTVITAHQDISGKADKSAAIGSLSLSLDSTNYRVTLSGTKVDGTSFTVSDVIDLPLESVVVNGSYNNTTKKVVLTLQSGSTVEFSVADLVAGLQSEITSTNKLSADLISDGTTNKTVTQTEKTTWNSKGTYSKPSGGIPKTDLASAVQTSLGLADTAVQSVTLTQNSSGTTVSVDGGTAIYLVSDASKEAYIPGSDNYIAPSWRAVTSMYAEVDFRNYLSNDFSLSAEDEIELASSIKNAINSISGKANSADLATVATSGSYNDLTNKPTIPAAQIQSDWNQTTTTAKDYIKNKPNIYYDGSKWYYSGVNYINFSSDTNIQLGAHDNLILNAQDEGSIYLNAAEKAYYNNKEIATKDDIPTVPTNVSAFTNDAGYLTSHQSLSNYVQKSNTSGLLKNDGTVDTSTYLTSHQTLKTINNESIVGSGNISIASGTTDTALTNNEIDTIWNNIMT